MREETDYHKLLQIWSYSIHACASPCRKCHAQIWAPTGSNCLQARLGPAFSRSKHQRVGWQKIRICRNLPCSTPCRGYFLSLDYPSSQPFSPSQSPPPCLLLLFLPSPCLHCLPCFSPFSSSHAEFMPTLPPTHRILLPISPPWQFDLCNGCAKKLI